MISDNNRVSVVIATLGGELLKDTIESLNSGSIKPHEILICIPVDFADRVKHFNCQNVTVIETNVKGQVAQRAKGFLSANCPYVLQLDDDIILDENCINYLLIEIKKKQKIAVSPMLYEIDTKLYHEFMVFPKSLSIIDRIILKIVNGNEGYMPGKISKSGVNFGLPEIPENVENIDWLPGACVLHRKKNLITHNYFPLKGKAYAEDLFHSRLLIDSGIKLNRVGSAKCYVDFASNKVSFVQLFTTYYSYLKAMRVYVRHKHIGIARLHIFVLVMIIRLIAAKAFNYVSVRVKR